MPTTWTIAFVQQHHYENFPVASLLCPPHLRDTVRAIYGFARTADDIADEGDASPQQRMATLQAYQQALYQCAEGSASSGAWPQVFEPLKLAIQVHKLPVGLLDDLLSAFMQDVVKHSYTDRTELLDYCRRSANPVGRLLLHLYGTTDSLAVKRSDCICSALQLINFWQDLSIDGPRGRVYVPSSDLARYGMSAQSLRECHDSTVARRLIEDMCDWAKALMLEGQPLVHQLPGRAGWELRLVVQGGLRILERMNAMQYACLLQRPVITKFDIALMLLRAIRMRATHENVQARAT